MIVAGTGHRPSKLGGYSQEAFNKLVEIAEVYLMANRPTKVISGGALGWDQALAYAAFINEIPFIAAIPFEGQEILWPDKSKKFYNQLLDAATEVVYCSKPGYSAYKMQIRNEWMVDNCDIVLAMYDGTKGGTYNCIEYAKSKNKQIINLFDKL